MNQFSFYGWIAFLVSMAVLLIAIIALAQHEITADQLRVEILLFLAVQMLIRIEAKRQ